MDSRKPLTAGEIQNPKVFCFPVMVRDDAGIHEGQESFVRASDYARLLSMLTPPPDAAVREAVESLQRMVDMDTFVDATAVKMQALVSYVRAVQAPRLTGEQVEFWVHLEDRLATNDTMWPKEKKSLWYRLRAAFPELAGEVDRG